jgi:Gram-negative bacterial TonB protein C-terminal
MKFWIGCALLLGSLAVSAAGPRAVRRQAEASMLVTGTIEVDAEGRVSRYGIDKKEKLPAAVGELLDKSIPNWRFEPAVVDGKPARAKTDMSLRVIARRVDDENYRVQVSGASFGVKARDSAETVTVAGEMSPPNFPDAAVRTRATGTVYLLLQVGRDGRVADVIAEQVNLRVVMEEHGMEMLRRSFAQAAMGKARTWTFNPPTRGDETDAQYWSVRVPVVFALGSLPEYGEWEPYIPGPRQRAPWDRAGESLAFSPDALPDGEVYLGGSGLKLLAAPGG